MKRVYLDQNKWIDLLAIAKGKRVEQRLTDVLRVVVAGAGIGHLSFPLSDVHYMELAHRRRYESRRELGSFMGGVSKYHTITCWGSIVRHEIDMALQERFGRPVVATGFRVFGYGIGHAIGAMHGLEPEVAREILGVVQRMGVHAPGSPLRGAFEWGMLCGPSPEDEEDMPDYNPLADQEYGREWASRRQVVRRIRTTEGWHRGERGKNLAMAEILCEDILWEQVDRAGIPASDILSMGKEGMTALVQGIPTLHCTCELGRLREAADSRPVSSNDLSDVSFLARALVYCDVVVTEKLWSQLIARAKLDERFGTIVMADTTGLTRHLI